MITFDLGPYVQCGSTNIGDLMPAGLIVPLHQSHGTRSVMLERAEDVAHTMDADALITQNQGLCIGVKTADCVPVLMYDAVSGTVAAVHSGWKGTVANIVGLTLRRMVRELGVEPGDVRAVIGPCIHQPAFEVGDELYDIFTAEGYGEYCKRMPRFGTDAHVQWHIDLPGICREQLARGGVNHVTVRSECTYTLHHQLYSARRLGPAFARQRIYTWIRMLPH